MERSPASPARQRQGATGAVPVTHFPVAGGHGDTRMARRGVLVWFLPGAACLGRAVSPHRQVWGCPALSSVTGGGIQHKGLGVPEQGFLWQLWDMRARPTRVSVPGCEHCPATGPVCVKTHYQLVMDRWMLFGMISGGEERGVPKEQQVERHQGSSRHQGERTENKEPEFCSICPANENNRIMFLQAKRHGCFSASFSCLILCLQVIPGV